MGCSHRVIRGGGEGEQPNLPICSIKNEHNICVADFPRRPESGDAEEGEKRGPLQQAGLNLKIR